MDWKPVTQRLPSTRAGIFEVKLSNGDEKKAYYYRDRNGWISFYGEKPTYWWDRETKQPLFNVTHWMNK